MHDQHYATRNGSHWEVVSLKASWMKLNHDSGYQVKVSHNIEKPKARYFSVCFTAPKTGWKTSNNTCKAHVRAVGSNREEMTIVSFDSNHSYLWQLWRQEKEELSNKRHRGGVTLPIIVRANCKERRERSTIHRYDEKGHRIDHQDRTSDVGD